QPRDLRFHGSWLESEQAGAYAEPEFRLLDHQFLPWRVSDEDVETRVRSEEHLGEENWHVRWSQFLDGLRHLWGASEFGDVVLGEDHSGVDGADACGDGDVENSLRGR